MLDMAKARLLAFAIAGVVGILAANSCSPFGGSGAFHCTDDVSCSGGPGEGRCEPNGYCSFLDPACGEGGRSYGSESGSLSGVCVGAEPPPDAQVFEDAPPVVVDAVSPEAGETCYGAPNGYVRPCFSMPLSGTRNIAGDIDTAPGSSDCMANVSNTTECVIAAGTLAIAAGNRLRVTGERALVLVAAQTIDIQGTLDVSSRRDPERDGANSNPPGGCGTPEPARSSGGGAGGTLGGEGGDGGDGDGNQGGTAVPVVAIAALRGGCSGSAGKNSNGGTGGLGGTGGGAVYLIATSIVVGNNGAINASGAAGGPGLAGDAGGGGGGSGGFIGLDAMTITNTGDVFANGGGGGEGSTNQAGAPGREANDIDAAAGGTGGQGGDGGAGGAVTPAGDGESSNNGGGGGGGGAGIVRTFRGAVPGNVAPAPTAP